MLKCPPEQYFIEIAIWNSVLDTITYVKVSSGHFELENTIKCYTIKRHKGSTTGKRARRKNLRHLRERFLLVSNTAEPRWRPEIFPLGVWDFSVLPSYRCLILFLTNILLKVQYFPSWDTPYMKYDMTHILTSLKNEVKGTEKDI
jgi:hypothetical protein